MKVIPKPDNSSKVVIDSWGGLDLLPDVLSRPFNSLSRAENVDLYKPGSLRKIIGPNLFNTFPSPILAMISYLRDATSSLKRIGLSANGHLYNLDDSTDYGVMGTIFQPWIGLFPSTAAGGVGIQYLVITVANGTPVKWEPVGGVQDIGVDEPTNAVSITASFSATASNNYLMQAGIQYLWTYFNPDTLHESSPSPVLGASIITPTTNAPPSATPYITQVKLDMNTNDPAVGTGYTRIRVYRTRDGGATFYLLPALYNAAGVDQLDANSSAPRSTPTSTFYDGVVASGIFPIPDQLLVNPPGGAPGIGANNPPPAAIWAAVYQNRMWLLQQNGRRVNFSNIGDFQSYGVFNFLDFSKDTDDTITAIVPLSDRLIFYGRNSARQLTGTDFTDFVEVPIDMRRGIVGRRAAVNDGDVIYGLTSRGLARMAFAQSGPPFIGDKIKPITDTIDPDSQFFITCAEIDTSRSQMLMGVRINGSGYNNQVIVTDLSRESPFTTIIGLPGNVASIKELDSVGGVRLVFYSDGSGNVYLLHDSVPGSLTATVETQNLPLDDYNTWRVFKSLDITGTDMQNWQIAFSTDGGNTFTTPQFISIPSGSKIVPIGLAGFYLIIRLIHNIADGVGALISRMTLYYENKVKGF